MAEPAAIDHGSYATIYTPSVLSIWYDAIVIGFNLKYVWSCPTSSILLPFFAEHFSHNHLDCGVATGYFPAHALNTIWRRNSQQSLVLLDINRNSLLAAKRRVQAVSPATDIMCIEADVTNPAPPDELSSRTFDSISMFNLFHCVPGGKGKLKAIGTFAERLSNHGVLVGCTVLGAKHSTSWWRTLYLRWYNFRLRVFNNWDDESSDIEEALREHFVEVETWVVGMVLLFRAKKPKRKDLIQM